MRERHPLVSFGWAPGDYIHAKCASCNPEGKLIHDLLTDGWTGDKLAWRCQPCAIKAKERFETMMDEQDRDIDLNRDEQDRPETPKPVSIAELARRGMDDRLQQIIQGSVGRILTMTDPTVTLTETEKQALGYGQRCPCGEKEMAPGEKLCGCGENCQECCAAKCQDCGCQPDCPCKA